MTVKTKKVQRRTLRLNNYEELLAEAERLAAAPQVTSLGNWNLAIALSHLTGAMRMSLDGTQITAPLLIRILGRLFKQKLLRGPMPAGHNAPERVLREFVPNDKIGSGEALEQFRAAIARLKRQPERHPHPVFGALTRDEWDQLHLRHAELHLSFHDAK